MDITPLQWLAAICYVVTATVFIVGVLRADRRLIKRALLLALLTTFVGAAASTQLGIT